MNSAFEWLGLSWEIVVTAFIAARVFREIFRE